MQKSLIIQQQFSKNVTFFMKGSSSSFFCFLSTKRKKGENSQGNWAKTQYNNAKISLKCNVFLFEVHRLYFAVFCKKRTKCEISERMWANTLIIQQQFSKNIMFFMKVTSSLFFYFLSKKRKKCEISERNWVKNPYKNAIIS